jgi:solute carrier family 25 S-adenosylmethionine transporter 26
MTEEFGVPAALEPTSAVYSGLVCGAFAGLSVDLALFPIETIKTRLMSSSREGHSFVDRGGFRGVYRGLGPALLGSVPSAALFFSVYNLWKEKAANNRYLVKGSISQDAFVYLGAAISGEAVACIVRVPVDAVKQPMQANVYKRAVEAAQALYGKGGVRIFYQSYPLTMCREIPFAIVQFPLWEWLKHKAVTANSGKNEALISTCCGSAAGSVAAAITTPIDVIRTRIIIAASAKQSTGHSRRSSAALLNELLAKEGVTGMFRGMVPRVTMISIGGFIFFGAYESARKLFC